MCAVSARLLADVDQKLRAFALGQDPCARNHKGVLRLVAGICVSYSGDRWQLPAPDGGFFGDIPCGFREQSRKYIPAPTIAHEQSLLWSGPETGIQGVTGLEKVNTRRTHGYEVYKMRSALAT